MTSAKFLGFWTPSLPFVCISRNLSVLFVCKIWRFLNPSPSPLRADVFYELSQISSPPIDSRKYKLSIIDSLFAKISPSSAPFSVHVHDLLYQDIEQEAQQYGLRFPHAGSVFPVVTSATATVPTPSVASVLSQSR